ncbi:MAG: 16S rRNA (cytosine(1402)-N(4))-methyltransferase RsmH [Ruminococcaceae bacterium]|nr:16S rRNA (cytosine(1402)-N(4))-methyltransferase RsmH [Oscillospiraceae bacterium]
MVFSHYSVLLNECIDALNIRDGYTYVDCTTGGGGHSLEIAKRLGKNSRLICFDRDSDAIEAASRRLADYKDKITFVHANFSSLGEVLDNMGIDNLGGVLADLGCSSYQFDTPSRGFSYQHNAPLDMRMDKDAPLDAAKVVNTYSEEALKRILWMYGEEKFAPRIAARIVSEREKAPIQTTEELVAIIRSAIPASAREGGHHPAKRTFQAIRIEVNGELDAIEPTVRAAVSHLLPGGRCAFISFQSLEDRIVKETYRDLIGGCTCPKDFPVCVCGHKPQIEILTKKPILPGAAELAVNPRSRSAKLRVAEKK